MTRPFYNPTCIKIWLILLLILLGVARINFLSVADAKKNTPELTSTALRLHKIYTQHPPHDRQLYDILKVNPSVTQAQITKSYRKLSREFHPDKKKSKEDADDDQEQQFQALQTAYEILKQDSTRMVYHKYGMTDPNLAILLLMGPTTNPTLFQQKLAKTSSSAQNLFDSLDPELLQLIGYDDDILQQSLSDQQEYIRMGLQSLRQYLEERRIRNIAAALVEHLRPIVEKRLPSTSQYTQYYIHALAQDCDRWKRLPLGAQIIRCVGRAYRNAGQDFLKQHSARRNGKTAKASVKHLPTDAVIGVRKRWRSAKHFLEAGAVSARLVVTEHFWKKNSKKRRQNKSTTTQKKPLDTIDYHDIEDDEESDSFLPIGIDDEMDVSLDALEHEQKLLEQDKAQKTLIQAMQIEALWKICKVDLDRIVRKACERILSGEYFFFPSHTAAANSCHASSVAKSNGWVAPSTGNTVDAEQARLLAAQAMVMFGDIMVQQSKQGTSWKQKK